MVITTVQKTHEDSRQAGSRAGALLWIVQGLLALLFLFAGGAKLVLPIELMTAQLPLPGAFLRFVGVCEVLGALGRGLPLECSARPGFRRAARRGLPSRLTARAGG